jgi:hypothetical protein
MIADLQTGQSAVIEVVEKITMHFLFEHIPRIGIEPRRNILMVKEIIANKARFVRILKKSGGLVPRKLSCFVSRPWKGRSSTVVPIDQKNELPASVVPTLPKNRGRVGHPWLWRCIRLHAFVELCSTGQPRRLSLRGPW